jgi:hypothetical protein
MKRTFTLLLIIAAVGCRETPSPDHIDKKRADTAQPRLTENIIDAGGCYRMVIGKDTADMQLENRDDSLTGTLTYKRFEKENNTGFVRLMLNAGKAEGFYRFRAEGKQSVRQIIFKYENDTFEEAYGDVIMKKDSAFYKYPSALRFEDAHPFKKISCK